MKEEWRGKYLRQFKAMFKVRATGWPRIGAPPSRENPPTELLLLHFGGFSLLMYINSH